MLRDHQVFAGPIQVDLSQEKTVATPDAWKDEIETKQIKVLPLVDDQKNLSGSGWCTYTHPHGSAPELEEICGGVNSKTPKAGAIWRQGHLMHFGFEESPDQLNENGNALLVNSICYISKFVDDRVNFRTPSIFYSHKSFTDRDVLTRLLKRDESYFRRRVKYYSSEDLFDKIIKLERQQRGDWLKKILPFISIDEQGKLTIDSVAQSLDLSTSEHSFFEKAASLLDQEDEDSKKVRELLQRYAPDGPNANNSQGKDWLGWHKANSKFLFFSDAGGYRWYIDRLAKKRGVSTEGASWVGPLNTAHHYVGGLKIFETSLKLPQIRQLLIRQQIMLRRMNLLQAI